MASVPPATTRAPSTPPGPLAAPPAPAHKPKPLDSVVYLGLNPTFATEVKSLDAASALDPPLTVVSGKIGSTLVVLAHATYDLANASDVSAFTRSVGVSDPTRLASLLNGITPNKRADVARFAMVMAEGEAGTRDVRRLIISGHSAANRLWGDGDGIAILQNGLWYKDLLDVVGCFPKAAAQVEHLMMSACSSGYIDQIEKYQAAFPSLQSVVAWAGSSPFTQKNAPWQLKTWLKTTEHASAEAMDPKLFGGAKGFTGTNVITWNKVDGYQGPSFAEAKAVVDAFPGALPKVKHDLDRLYFALVGVIFSTEFDTMSPPEQDALKQRAADALSLRHPAVAPLNALGVLKNYF